MSSFPFHPSHLLSTHHVLKFLCKQVSLRVVMYLSKIPHYNFYNLVLNNLSWFYEYCQYHTFFATFISQSWAFLSLKVKHPKTPTHIPNNKVEPSQVLWNFLFKFRHILGSQITQIHLSHPNLIMHLHSKYFHSYKW